MMRDSDYPPVIPGMKSVFILWVVIMACIIHNGNISAKTDPTGRIPLNGQWQFAVDTAGAFSIDNVVKNAEWRTARVPLAWQAQFRDLRDYQGVAWYRKQFSLKAPGRNANIVICFEAVDYLAEVYINGKPAGKHEGGYTPFEFNVSSLVKQGDNEVIVRVMDPAATEKGTEGISYWNIPHGKQSWYVQTSGIWRDAEVAIYPAMYISQVHITPSTDGKITVDGVLEGKPGSFNDVMMKVIAPDKKTVLEHKIKIAPDKKSFQFEGGIKNPGYWSFENPELYTAEFQLGSGNKVSERFGFRSIEARDQRLYLNGKPFYLVAALDQDFYPEEIYTTPSEAYLRDEMLKAKKMGLNMLRCHIKVPDRLYLKVADEVGLLVWYEIPNWDTFSADAAKRGEETLDAMLRRDWNHPSLVIISLINESWGIDLQRQEQRQWLRSAYERFKRRAKGRLIVDNSACWGNFHVKTDINDYHTYYSIPENRKQFSETVKSVAERAEWLFSKFGDSGQTGQEPLLISEFGNWGLPVLPEKLPWWFERQFQDAEVSLPKDVYKRFRDYAYEGTFGSYNELAEESQRAQYMELKYEIEEIRLHPEIQGYVITEFTDINWESNGLLDMWRKPKVSAENLAPVQQQDVIIPRPVRYTYAENETVELKLYVSSYSGLPTNDLKLRWKTPDSEWKVMPLSIPEEALVQEIPSVSFMLKKVLKPRRIRVDFELLDGQGRLRAVNYTEVFQFPASEGAGSGEFTLYDPSGRLKSFSEALMSKGYKTSGVLSQAKFIVTSTLDEQLMNKLKGGASVLCFPDSTTRLPGQLKILSRSSDWLDGNWATNMNWIRSDRQPFKEFGFGKYLGFESAHSSPKMVISGIPPEDFKNVLSGMYIGWLHMNSAYIYQMEVGKGLLILCTLPVAETFSGDPFAVGLFDRLRHYAEGRSRRKSDYEYKRN